MVDVSRILAHHITWLETMNFMKKVVNDSKHNDIKLRRSCKNMILIFEYDGLSKESKDAIDREIRFFDGMTDFKAIDGFYMGLPIVNYRNYINSERYERNRGFIFLMCRAVVDERAGRVPKLETPSMDTLIECLKCVVGDPWEKGENIVYTREHREKCVKMLHELGVPADKIPAIPDDP
eukprot:GHVL01040096.1.p1 GENE.GHVL01040096.1~~GHVL01040096.1.p1  ORF type:complete len:179 (-),score=26.38 GHVL01040096.1:362-898(-)